MIPLDSGITLLQLDYPRNSFISKVLSKYIPNLSQENLRAIESKLADIGELRLGIVKAILTIMALGYSELEESYSEDDWDQRDADALHKGLTLLQSWDRDPENRDRRDKHLNEYVFMNFLYSCIKKSGDGSMTTVDRDTTQCISLLLENLINGTYIDRLNDEQQFWLNQTICILAA